MAATLELPSIATTEQAIDWLGDELGSRLCMANLVEMGCLPYVWVDPTPETIALFENHPSGFLAGVCFAPDLFRVEAQPSFMRVQMLRTPEFYLVNIEPPKCFDIGELRWKASDLRAIAQTQKNRPAPPTETFIKGCAVSGSEILRVNWCLPGTAPMLENILKARARWFEICIVRPGTRGRDVALYNVAIFAIGLATRGGNKGWCVPPSTVRRTLSRHFPDALDQFDLAFPDALKSDY